MTLGELKHTAETFWESLEPIKPHLDVASIGLLITALFQLIPGVTTIITLLWSLIRLYETATVQAWLARRRARKGVSS
jgi:hypothetical protein